MKDATVPKYEGKQQNGMRTTRPRANVWGRCRQSCAVPRSYTKYEVHYGEYFLLLFFHNALER